MFLGVNLLSREGYSQAGDRMMATVKRLLFSLNQWSGRLQGALWIRFLLLTFPDFQTLGWRLHVIFQEKRRERLTVNQSSPYPFPATRSIGSTAIFFHDPFCWTVGYGREERRER